jgi:nucleoside-diphosphate-sugar epimerase
MKVLVTGANGFIGRALCLHLFSLGHEVVPIVRRGYKFPQGQVVPPYDDQKWDFFLNRCDVVIHLAGRTHVMCERNSDPLEAFRVANIDPTMQLAIGAVEAGVKRFIFISSIKVNGEETIPDTCFKPDDAPQPKGAYAVSKYEAEQALLAFALENLLEVVIIRPPLVYGPNVKGNFASMLRWVKQGTPLPLLAIKNNRRSLVSLHNLIDLISTCMIHPNATNQIFLAGDGEDLSTCDLIKRTCKALCVAPSLFYVHPMVLKTGARMINKLDLYQRLCSSLQVDITKNQILLGWKPAITVDEGLRRAVQGI